MENIDILLLFNGKKIWKDRDLSQLVRYFKIRKMEYQLLSFPENADFQVMKKAQKDREYCTVERKRLREEGFVWEDTDQESLLMNYFDKNIPENVIRMIGEICTTDVSIPLEELKKKRKIAKLRDHMKEREDFLLNYTGEKNSLLAPELNKGYRDEYIEKNAPDCIVALKPWCMSQFHSISDNSGRKKAKRSDSTFTMYESSGDQQAVNWIRAGLKIQEFMFRGAFRNENGRLVIVTETREEDKTDCVSLFSYAMEKGPIFDQNVWFRHFSRLSEITDILYQISLCWSPFSCKNMFYNWNGDMFLTGIENMKMLNNTNKTTMINGLGDVLHYLTFRMPFEKRDQLSKRERDAHPETNEFIKRARLTDPQYCFKHPISKNTFFMKDEMDLAENRGLIKTMEKQKKNAIPLKITDYIFPKTANASSPAYFKQNRALSVLLDHFNSQTVSEGEKIKRPLKITFLASKDSKDRVESSIFMELWRFFIQCHSLWQLGPRGYYLGTGKTACLGCQNHFCKFATVKICSSLGRWLANTLFNSRHHIVPVPLDPLFVDIIIKKVHFFAGLTSSEAHQEYVRLIDGRKDFLESTREALLTACDMSRWLEDQTNNQIASLLCRPKILKRKAITKNITIICVGKLNAVCESNIMEWLENCNELQMRNFLFEVTGSPVYEEPKKITIYLTADKIDKTTSNICEKSLVIPVIKDQELLYAVLDFGGPFLFV